MYVPNKAGMRFWLPKIDEISDGAFLSRSPIKYIHLGPGHTVMYVAIVCQTKSSIFWISLRQQRLCEAKSENRDAKDSLYSSSSPKNSTISTIF